MDVVMSHAMASFLTSMWMNDVLKSAWKAVHVLSDGGGQAQGLSW